MPAQFHESSTTGVQQFTPLFTLQQAFRYWWLLPIMGILGGLAGMVVNRIQPPIYEARVQFSASIDFQSTGYLTQYEEDVALNAVGGLLSNATALKEQVVQRANAEGISITLEELGKRAVFERKVTEWVLRVRSTDPQEAARLANIWAELGDAALREAYGHAEQAYRLNAYLRSLESCMEESAVLQPAQPLCQPPDLVAVQQIIRDTGAALTQERNAAQGLFVGLMLGPTEKAVVPDQPVSRNRNLMVLAGTLLGLLCGLFLLQTPIPVLLTRKKHVG